MKVVRITVFVFGVLIFSLKSFSQNNDTIPKVIQEDNNRSRRATAFITQKFAIARPFNIEFMHSTPYNFTSEKGDNSLPESKIKRFSQAKISANINFIKQRNWLLGTTLGYNYTSLEANMIVPSSGGIKSVENDFHYFYAAANFTYFSTLFNKRTIFTSSLIVDGSEKHFERVRGLLSGTLVLKANEQTKMSIGIAVNLDPLSEMPIIPTFSYEHKFNNGFMADIILPKNIYIRKHVFTNGRISLGAEMGQITFYLYNIDDTPQRYQYRQLDINSGLVYEHFLANFFMITAKTGLRYTPSGRLFRKEDSYGNPLFKISLDPTFYFNIGISFNPSSFIGKKK